MKKLLVLSLIFILGLPAIGQVPQMRTRILTSLTNVEVEQYLKRNDVIFIPVGPTEVHGGMPLDCEYVGPLAYCIKMAEKADGLVFPNVSYIFPGATVVGSGTVQFSNEESIQFLKIIARTLYRQGFKTQIYVTGHGPSPTFMSPFMRDFFNEEHIALFHMDQMKFEALAKDVNTRNGWYGAYKIVGRLEDIPLSFEGIDLNEDYESIKAPSSNAKLKSVGTLGGFYYSVPSEHFGIPVSITASEREQRANEGAEAIEKVVDAIGILEIVNGLKEHQKFSEEIIERYGDLLKF